MIRNEVLEHFILGYGLEIPDEGRGRPVALPQLQLAAKAKCPNCSMDEILDALFNLDREHAELNKFFPFGEKYLPVSFETVRPTTKWKEFFYGDPFRIKVLPAGRVRFQELAEKASRSHDMGRANLKVRELALRVQNFHDDLETHFDLWLQSLQQPIPDYPVRNIEKLREQTTSLARQLGTLRPYIKRFTASSVMTVMGQRWDAYDCAVSNDVSVRKGPSIEAVLPQLQQMLGRLELMNPDEEIPLESKGSNEKPGTVNIYNLHGAHSRVNIQSEDKSVNVSSITEQQVFSGIRRAVSQGIPEVNEREIILEKLDSLEKSVHSRDFLSKYQEFINTVASHMTIIAPFLPALTQMLGN
ncbi:MAG TPA: hypothetical protein VNZ03_01240 [Terriglobales bacterium]|jgi:hypothetical protein|nr:hypothetical protein [Terriglobales bacterium]